MKIFRRHDTRHRQGRAEGRRLCKFERCEDRLALSAAGGELSAMEVGAIEAIKFDDSRAVYFQLNGGNFALFDADASDGNFSLDDIVVNGGLDITPTIKPGQITSIGGQFTNFEEFHTRGNGVTGMFADEFGSIPLESIATVKGDPAGPHGWIALPIVDPDAIEPVTVAGTEAEHIVHRTVSDGNDDGDRWKHPRGQAVFFEVAATHGDMPPNNTVPTDSPFPVTNGESPLREANRSAAIEAAQVQDGENTRIGQDVHFEEGSRFSVSHIEDVHVAAASAPVLPGERSQDAHGRVAVDLAFDELDGEISTTNAVPIGSKNSQYKETFAVAVAALVVVEHTLGRRSRGQVQSEKTDQRPRRRFFA